MFKDKRYNLIAKYVLGVGFLLILMVASVMNFGAVCSALGKGIKILSPFIIGFAMAYLMRGPVRFFERCFEKCTLIKNWSFGVRRGLSILISYLIVGAACMLLIAIVLPEVMRTLIALVSRAGDAMNGLRDTANQLMVSLQIPEMHIEEIFASFNSFFGSLIQSFGSATKYLYSFMQNFVNGALNTMLGLMTSVYVLFAREQFASLGRKIIYVLFKLQTADGIMAVCRRSDQVFSIYIYVRIMSSVIVGLLTYVFMELMGYPMSMLIGVVAGVTNFIPVFGPLVGTGIGMLLLLTESPISMLWFMAFSIALQQLEGNYITPKITGNKIGLPAFWVLVGAVVGGGVFGMWGMILGVPAIAIIYALGIALIESKLIARGIEDQT
ncbi:MAG: AI-2E family transporter [Clostridia bacterium]|nr:AI-2E family transporter [Clostridia bacterium]